MLVKVPRTHLFTLPLAVTRFVAVFTDVRAESNLIAALLTRGGGGAGGKGGEGEREGEGEEGEGEREEGEGEEGETASELRSCMFKNVCTYVHDLSLRNHCTVSPFGTCIFTLCPHPHPHLHLHTHTHTLTFVNTFMHTHSLSHTPHTLPTPTQPPKHTGRSFQMTLHLSAGKDALLRGLLLSGAPSIVEAAGIKHKQW